MAKVGARLQGRIRIGTGVYDNSTNLTYLTYLNEDFCGGGRAAIGARPGAWNFSGAFIRD